MLKPTGVIVMTALVPTKGHQALVQFAIDYFASSQWKSGTLHVILCSRSIEPVAGADRLLAFQRQFVDTSGVDVTFHEIADDRAPQNPPDHPDFWGWWHQKIWEVTGTISNASGGFYLFASETYGLRLAEQVGARFVPFDIGRHIVQTTGTAVRTDVFSYFREVMPSYQAIIRPTVTIFGAESTGKTTLAADLARAMDGVFVPEWARQYLEAVGPKLDHRKMETIAAGQYASQLTARSIVDKPVIVQDTDLLSTIGYYRVMGIQAPTSLLEHFDASKANLYLLTKSNIPFIPDQLRYGGDRRETTDDFWVSLLDEFGCKCAVLEEENRWDRVTRGVDLITDLTASIAHPIAKFQRK